MKAIYSENQAKDFTLSEKINVLCEKLESWRILLLSAFLLFQGCIIVPAIVLISSFNDIGITGLSILIAAFGTVAILVSNMSEAGIKTILVIFIVNFILSITLIGIHLISWINTI